MNRKKAYMYTRVSTAMQVDGYSLDAQEEEIRRYCEYHKIDIVGSYKKGTHLEHKRAKDLITYLQCREITVEYANPQNVVFDGEAEVCNSICVRVSEKPVRVFLPKGVSLRGVTPEDHDAVLNVEDIADVANSATEERVEETAEV